MLRLKRKYVKDQALIKNKNTTSPYEATSVWRSTKEVIKNTLDATIEGFEAVAEVVDAAVELVDGWGDTVQNVGDTFLNLLEDPLNVSSDYGGTLQNTATSKTDPSKECGTITLVGDVLQGVNEVVSNLSQQVTQLRGSSGMDAAQALDWKSCVALSYSTIQTSVTNYGSYVEDIVKLCGSIRNQLNLTDREALTPANEPFLNDLIEKVTAARSEAISAYTTYRNRQFFNRSDWAAAKDDLKEAYEFIDENWGELNEDSYSIFTGNIPTVLDRINQVKFKLCLVSDVDSSLREVSTNITNVSSEKPNSPVATALASFIDRLKCHLDYILKRLDKLKKVNVYFSTTTVMDLYLHIKQIYVVMDSSESFIYDQLKAEDTSMTYAVSEDSQDTAAINSLGFIAATRAFLTEAYALLYSPRSLKRLDALLDQVRSTSVTAKSSLTVYTDGLADENGEYSEAYSAAAETLSQTVSIIANNSEIKDALLEGRFSDAASIFTQDFLTRRFESYVNVASLSLVVREKINDVIESRRADKISRDLEDYMNSKTSDELKAEQAEKKTATLDQFLLLKQLAGTLRNLGEYKNSVAEFNKLVLTRQQNLPQLYNDFKQSGKVSLTECQRKVK